MRSVCFYHHNCFDGIASAWVAKRAIPDVELVPAVYGMDVPELGAGDNVYIVDFSFPRDIMIDINQRVAMLRVLDHHKTAQENCVGLDFCTFDMNESGASLAWKYFFPHKPIPTLIKYIKDRDLWLFKEDDSEAVNAYIQSYPMDVNIYDDLALNLDTGWGLRSAMEQGKAIERYKNQLVQQIIKNRFITFIGDYRVPVVNCPVLMSEVGHALAELNEGPFGAYYFDRRDGFVQWGARSIGDFDVSEVAKTFGGGGHKNAAGWQRKID